MTEERLSEPRSTRLQEGTVAQNTKAPHPKTKPTSVGGSNKKK